jgi:hypothetical protein
LVWLQAHADASGDVSFNDLWIYDFVLEP